MRALTGRPALTLTRSSALSPSIRFSSTTTQASDSTIIRNAPVATTPTSKSYAIELTPSEKLPVYPKTKAAGQSKFTIVKRVRGDKRAFIQDLMEGLSIPKDEISLQPVTGHIQVKGFRVEEVKKWLAESAIDKA